MNSRTLIALLASLAVLVALAIAVSLSQRPVITSGGPFLPGFREQLNDVSRIVVRTAGNSTVATLERREDGWIVAERNGYPADIGKIRNNLIALADAKLLEEKTSNPEMYSRLKVEDIDKDTAAGVGLDITVGDKTTGIIVGTTGVGGGERAYARLTGQPASWLISGALDISREPAEWLDRMIADIPGKRVQAVTITHPDGAVLRIEKDAPEAADFKVAGLSTGRELAFPGVGNALGGALAELRLDSVEPAAGFAPGAIKPVTARFETFDGLVVQADSWKLPAGLRLRFKASADPALAERFAVKPAGPEDAKGSPAPATEPRKSFDEVKAEAAQMQKRLGNWVYAVPEFQAEQFTRRPDDLLAPDTVGPPRP